MVELHGWLSVWETYGDEDELGAAVADYMAMLDGTMKEYFLKLPDEREAMRSAEEYYQKAIKAQSVIV